MCELEISASNTRTERSSTLSSSGVSHRTKKRKWWMSDLFEMREHSTGATNVSSTLFLTCKGCSWYTNAKIPNTTKLGQHLLRCGKIYSAARQRLLADKRLREYYNSTLKEGGSDLFGVPVTPAISRNRKRKVSQKSDDSVRKRVCDSSQTKPKAVTYKLDVHEENSEDSYDNRTRFNELLTKFMVKHMLSFSLLSRQPGSDDFFQLITIASPLLGQQLPTPRIMGNKNVKRYYEAMRSGVLESIAGLLSEGYATLIFDEWTDTCGASVVNVFLSLTGTQKVRRTFFLRSIYTGSKSCDAALYAGLCEEAIAEYGDIQRVCAVVSDNTSSCIKAKELLFQKYTHLVSVKDQPHMANLLMQDIGDISWVKEVLSIVSTVIADLRNHPKLYSRFKNLKTAFNLQCSAQSSLGTDCYGRVQLPKTAILPCRMVATRFTSSESMAASFLRSKEVILRLVDCPDFNARLYGSRNHEKRDLFKQNVRNDSLYQKLLDIYHILRLIRQYLRLFDDESSLLSEVYPATMQLFTKIKSLPLTSFYTAKRRADVIRVFEERLNGANRKVALLTPLHRVSYLLDIWSMMENLNAYRPHVIRHILSFVRSDLFPVSEKLSSDGGEDAAVQRLCDEFLEVRLSWRSQLSDPVLRHSLMMYSRSPVYYWTEYTESPRLREFALRILCSSPSSSSVERSFSLQSRIRTSMRNRLHTDKVSQLVFCACNETLFLSRSRTVQKLSRDSYAELRFGKGLDAIEGMESGQVYAGFLDDEYVSRDDVIEGDDDLELDELDNETFDLLDADEALEMI